MPINYKTKVNERLTGSPISSEPHTIGIVGVFTAASGVVRLVEVPQAPSPFSTVSIPGYNEITVGSPTGTQFLVDYTTGVITFNVSQNTNAILVSYIGLGSEIAAEDINELQIPVGIALNANGTLSAGIVTTSSISGSAVIPLTNLQTLNNSIVPVTNGSGVLISSTTTAAELAALSALTFPLTVPNGGTGGTTLTAHGVLIGEGASAVASTSAGTSRQVLVSNGASADPTFQTIATGTGISSLSGDVTTSPAPGGLLATAASYAVLGASTVTNTATPTALTGDLGLYPGTSVTGFPPGTYTGTLHQTDSFAQQAQLDALAAYNTIVAMGGAIDETGNDLGTLTLAPGVYKYTSTAQLTGTLTLNALGNPNAQWFFQIGSTLTTASASSVVFLGGVGSPGNVYWQVGSSATLGTTTAFQGTIIAQASITANTGASALGSLIALTAAVTLDDNAVTATGSSGTVATVVSVGGSSAANIHTAELAANAATALDTPSTIVKRNGSGSFAISSISFNDTEITPKTVTLEAPTTLTNSYTLKFPLDQSIGAQVLTNDGAGNLSWVTASGTTYTGTTNQIVVTGTVLSTPQDIATTSTPTFQGMTITKAGLTSLLINATGVALSQIQLEGNGNSNYISTSSDGSFSVQGNDSALFIQYNPSSGILQLVPTTNTRITNSVGIGEAPVSSAILDVASTTKGFLPPRMTNTEINAIASPAEGLIAYDLTNHQWLGYNGTAWAILG